MSGRLKMALASAPDTKPNCTAMVSQEAAEPASPPPQMAVSCGMAAVPENHIDVPSSSAMPTMTSTRRCADSKACVSVAAIFPTLTTRDSSLPLRAHLVPDWFTLRPSGSG